jgi:hypothetical protein
MRRPRNPGRRSAGSLLCFLLLALLQVCVPLRAQSTRGELAGNVTDSSGAVIPGAKVTATGIETGTKSETVTTSSGSYHFTELPIGRYDVTSAGFATSTSTGVLVTINSTAVLNVSMKAGAVTESVTVDASAPTIESETSDISGTITQQQIEDLPIAVAAGVGGLRSPEAFSFLVPGTTGPGTGTGQDFRRPELRRGGAAGWRQHYAQRERLVVRRDFAVDRGAAGVQDHDVDAFS